MVMATLRVICRNCGSVDDLTYERDYICEDGGDLSKIKCANCATIHFLQAITR